ncbi:glutamine amidotransferase [Isoptericola sp. b441]|uniref:Glutamine amidotransferase n=1 Tax=Actinotalea lenta TaxID=3064654 RepID=A0ABT9D7C3_9CELL|nr:MULTISPECIES: glutamine amidotransferase [unclassified Isoptericola]MDO8106747.1 glutamine amidotransferase [Isoptericola sp. b441]MDO8121541.1 glutamine amidotransferase [Isoptericola sp. b490]
MSSVLVIGESWFVHCVHQKGFDAFTSSSYEEGGTAFLEALRSRGHTVTYVPSHTIAERVPTSTAEMSAFDVVVVSDVGANSFQLPPRTFEESIPTPDRTEVLRAFVEQGGGLLMVGGYLTFSGIDGRARWGRTPLADALPVDLLDRDDRVEMPAGAEPTMVVEHPVVHGLDHRWPALLGLNEVRARPGSQTLATCGGHPLLVVGEYGSGRSAAFTSDIAPHWAPPAFLEWHGYAELFDRLVAWLARA